MSGRDHEPIAAFFPSIDRNLIRDLDRHLRGASPSEPQQQRSSPDDVVHTHDEAFGDARQEAHEVQPQAAVTHSARPSTSEVLEAVQQAASSMASMGERIEELETHQHEVEAVNLQLRNKLGELLQLQQATEARARAESERAARAEEIAAQHLSRAQTLESDLEAALSDLHRIAEAITGTLGTQYQR